MLSYAVLGSGSSANAYIISRNGRSIMVDNGFSVREALQRMALAGIDPESLDGLFLTHTHGDHLKGVGALCRRLKIPLFTAEGLVLPNSVGKIAKRYEMQPGKDYRFSWMECRPFETSHDADKSVGYSFSIDGIRISIITDTGIVSDEMASIAAESRLLFLEANYDEEMLAEGPYPLFLQRRISSDYGHLSNMQAADFLCYLKDQGAPEKTYLCHLSENNNTPEKVHRTLNDTSARDMTWTVAPRGELLAGSLK